MFVVLGSRVTTAAATAGAATTRKISSASEETRYGSGSSSGPWSPQPHRPWPVLRRSLLCRRLLSRLILGRGRRRLRLVRGIGLGVGLG